MTSGPRSGLVTRALIRLIVELRQLEVVERRFPAEELLLENRRVV
jgi:hypothetical protein